MQVYAGRNLQQVLRDNSKYRELVPSSHLGEGTSLSKKASKMVWSSAEKIEQPSTSWAEEAYSGWQDKE